MSSFARKEARYRELLQARCTTEALIENAKRWSSEPTLVPRERAWWKDRLSDLEQQHREDNARMRTVLSQEDKDRFAEEREQARREDREFNACENATDWESL